MRFLEELLDAVFPPRCPLCGRPTIGGEGCVEHALPAAPEGPRCDRCASRLPDALPDGSRCAACRRSPPRFRRIAALADWRRQIEVREWVLAFKHGGRRDLAGPLGSALARRLLGYAAGGAASSATGEGRSLLAGRVLLVPVPLHPLRHLERGYDQAWLLAREVSERTGLRVRRALRRRRWTSSQGAPGSRTRSANVRDAFVVRERFEVELEGARIWLVDDVATSGATASECARALHRGGAREVSVLCVARA